ncbi:hypothetical protein IVB14_12325 [Bradyrhizobium sp. 180]|uniref:hypothetical protein n=1 Tax=unclassified Bradyrhizobium TaxID=2631580 RepID=UPI001FF7F571|nr:MULTISPECIES: hypothetical protein [unclassified Bradyrhizobium]MCK1491179.1 hypothetical protein [Bradyrhizobium sp. 180]MCK1424691.1 hypothetical protein [Bradyrhizobium sp. CW12]MCK1530009.1 hypothetical protein [Bradyrhizobium sp. 182]MCK1593884.1 hypothetical protein [Bradyrhizobium sp. 164]MCK1649560.1 hypothetical protein [Bradyrhizobium sp. 154]
MLGDGNAEHHHDDQEKPQGAPTVLSRRALRFAASGHTERPIGISLSQNWQIIGASRKSRTWRGNSGT